MPKFASFPSEENIPILTEVEDRVEFISDLMEDMVWHRGKSAKILAKRWGLAKGTVENHAAEASRRVTADADTVRRTITAQGTKLMADAYRSGKAKDWSLVSKLMAEVSGANAPVKHDIAVTDDASPARARELLGTQFRGNVGKQTEEPESAIEGEPDDVTEED